MPFTGQHIWIVGASTGIGRALAYELFATGASLILSARSEDALHELNEELGGNHLVMPLDVADIAQINRVAEIIADSVPQLDRVVCLAALYQPAPIKNMDLGFAQQLFDVNVLGTMAVAQAVLPLFRQQPKGQLALCGSVAGYVGLPNGQPYSASKAAIINFAESLRAEVDEVIDIKLINPGFVRTPMTDQNDFEMPMCIEPEEAAEAIAQGLKSRAFEIHFPRKFTFIMKCLRALPYPLQLFLTRKMRS